MSNNQSNTNKSLSPVLESELQPKLYVFYLGGSAGQSNIEVHDIQFVVGTTPERCYETLRQRWYGHQKGLHIDGYQTLTWADGYRIELSNTPSLSENKLFFVNAGGYQKNKLTELHEFDFFVAKDAKDAKTKGLKSLLSGFLQQHKDNLIDVDDCIELTGFDKHYIHLVPDDKGCKDSPLFLGYLRIDNV